MVRAFLLFLISCSDLGDRKDWLEEQLFRDNRIWVQRVTVQLVAKLEKMTSDPYNYMRGTLGGDAKGHSTC